jgi:16S rRNA (guanine966-N2)-methyltransferase
MRIISGQWRGRPLAAPKGEVTRPTADRTREALFSMLASRIGSFEGLRVADLFAGSGALGLEALSRGAAHATFVDQDKAAVTAIKANIAKLGGDRPAFGNEVVATAVAALGPARQPFDLLLLDPPYRTGGGGALLERLTRLGWASDAAWASVETASDETVSAEGWTLEADRSHGKAKISLLARVAPSTARSG